LNRNEAYVMYKKQGGASLNSTLLSFQKPLNEVKHSIKAACAELNRLKSTIDTKNSELERAREQRQAEMSGVAEEEDIVDEEEFKLMMKLKQHKKEYKAKHAQYKKDLSDKKKLQTQVQAAKVELVQKFDEWYSQSRPTTSAVQAGPEDEEGDAMDDGELFEQLELNRVSEEDPDSLAFFQAQKKMNNTANHNRTSNMRKQKLKRNQ